MVACVKCQTANRAHQLRIISVKCAISMPFMITKFSLFSFLGSLDATRLLCIALVTGDDNDDDDEDMLTVCCAYLRCCRFIANKTQPRIGRRQIRVRC